MSASVTQKPKLPKLAIEEVPIDEVKPNPRNVRRHSPKQVKQLAESIKNNDANKHFHADSITHINT